MLTQEAYITVLTQPINLSLGAVDLHVNHFLDSFACRSGTYLMLANYLVKRLLPRSGLTIAEDSSSKQLSRDFRDIS